MHKVSITFFAVLLFSSHPSYAGVPYPKQIPNLISQKYQDVRKILNRKKCSKPTRYKGNKLRGERPFVGMSCPMDNYESVTIELRDQKVVKFSMPLEDSDGRVVLEWGEKHYGKVPADLKSEMTKKYAKPNVHSKMVTIKSPRFYWHLKDHEVFLELTRWRDRWYVEVQDENLLKDIDLDTMFANPLTALRTLPGHCLKVSTAGGSFHTCEKQLLAIHESINTSFNDANRGHRITYHTSMLPSVDGTKIGDMVYMKAKDQLKSPGSSKTKSISQGLCTQFEWKQKWNGDYTHKYNVYYQKLVATRDNKVGVALSWCVGLGKECDTINDTPCSMITEKGH